MLSKHDQDITAQKNFIFDGLMKTSLEHSRGHMQENLVHLMRE